MAEEYIVTSTPEYVDIDTRTGEITQGHMVYFTDLQTSQPLKVFVPQDQFSRDGARNYILDKLKRARDVRGLTD